MKGCPWKQAHLYGDIHSVMCKVYNKSEPYATIFPQMNVGGASDRPVPADIWNIVQLKLSGDADEQTIQEASRRVRTRGFFSICAIL